MSTLEKFYKDWRSRFPNQELPADIIHRIEIAIDSHRQRIIKLEKELKKETATVNYLQRILLDNEAKNRPVQQEITQDASQEVLQLSSDPVPGEDLDNTSNGTSVSHTGIALPEESLDSGHHSPITVSTGPVYHAGNSEQKSSDEERNAVESASTDVVNTFGCVENTASQLLFPGTEDTEDKSALGDDSDLSQFSGLDISGHSDYYSNPTKSPLKHLYRRSTCSDTSMDISQCIDDAFADIIAEEQLDDQSSSEEEIDDDSSYCRSAVDSVSKSSSMRSQNSEYVSHGHLLERSDSNFSGGSSECSEDDHDRNFLDKPVAIDTLMKKSRVRPDLNSCYVNIESISGSFAYQPHDLQNTVTEPQLENLSGIAQNTEKEISRHYAAQKTSSGETKRLSIYKAIVTSVMDGEASYVECLEVIIQYMKALKATVDTSQPVMTIDDYNIIFYKIPQLHLLHSQFLQGLQKRVDAWDGRRTIADLFKQLVSELGVYEYFLQNYPKACETVEKCIATNEQFAKITRGIKLKSSREVLSLEDLLHKPVLHIQKNALVLHDLLKYTPDDHPDSETLRESLKLTKAFLHDLNHTRTSGRHPSLTPGSKLYLEKESFIIELVEGHRKLRHLFLFENVLVCAKQKVSGHNKYSYECKWYIPLSDLLLVEDSELKQVKEHMEHQRADIDVLKSRVAQLRDQIKKEGKKEKRSSRKQSSIRRPSRTVVKLQKRLSEHEAALVLALPNLVFRVCHKHGKTYTFLVSSDFERQLWKNAIGLQQAQGPSGPPVTIYELQETLAAITSQNLSQLGAVIMQTGTDREEPLTGDLHVILKSITGVEKPADIFCCLETDSYGHFILKARTNICLNSTSPTWDQEFVLDIEGSQTLRILIYEVHHGHPDKLLGTGTVELGEWVKPNHLHNKIIQVGNMVASLSIKYISCWSTLRRKPAALQDVGVFGVRIRDVCKREMSKVPFIVRACTTEVERRGIKEMGIYRVSGASSVVQKLKQAFNTSQIEAAKLVCEADIHAVASVLKLYLRELPEPLFTDRLYHDLIEGFALSDPESKYNFMLGTLNEVPEPNFSTILCLMEHMIKLNKYEVDNKMSLHNLATVFGPTLLRPATTPGENIDTFAAGTMDVMCQMHILYYFLQLKATGHSLLLE